MRLRNIWRNRPRFSKEALGHPKLGAALKGKIKHVSVSVHPDWRPLMRTFAHILLASAALGIIASPAHADSSASGGARISLVVPEICQIEDASFVMDASGAASGTVFEMCNSGRGFRVIASYRSLEQGEQIEINYGGQIRQLDNSGISDIAQRSGPVVGDVPVSIRATKLTQNIAVTLGFAII